MNIEKVFSDFCNSLQGRTCVISEDTIRYYWFAAMMKNDKKLDLNNYSLEYPYNLTKQIFERNKAKKELDFLYNNGEECYCIEIKFHRNPDSNSTYAHPDAAGNLFNDLIRLSVFQPGKVYEKSLEKVMILPQNTRRFLLYITDDEMNQYFIDSSKSQKCYLRGYRQPLSCFYQLRKNDVWTPSFIDPTPETFTRNALSAMAGKYKLSDIPKVKLVCSHDKLIVNSDSIKFSETDRIRHCYARLYEITCKSE